MPGSKTTFGVQTPRPSLIRTSAQSQSEPQHRVVSIEVRPLALAVHLAFAASLLTAVGGVPVAQAQTGSASSAQDQVQEGNARHFNIPAGPLSTALTRFSTEAGIFLVGATDLAQGKNSPGVQGNFSVPAALNQLLVGTGLQAQANSQGQYVLRDVSGATTLPPLRVSADVTSDIPQSHLHFLNKDISSGALGNKSVLDTPFSITVVDEAEIVEHGAKSIGQIFFRDPSVYTPTPSFNTDWWGTQIRGLGVRNHYIDDIPLMLNWGGDFPIEVIDSVSALKGLTGFMYGFGTPGGALSYQLKRPSKTPETSVTAGYRNPSLFNAHVDTSHNLGGDLALRANVATEQGTAYNASEIERSVVSLALDKQFGASLLWKTTLVYEDNKNTGEPFQFYLSDYDAVGSGGRMPQVTYDYDAINVDNAYYETETLLATTGADWRIDDQWTLNYQLGFSRKDHRSNKAFVDLLNAEGDYSGAIYNFAGRLDTLFTQAMLQGTVEALGMTHELVGGVGYQRNKTQYSDFDYRSDEFMGNIHVSQPYRVQHMPDFSLNPARPEIVQQDAFLSDTIHFNEHWQGIAGLRFTNYHNKADYRTREVSPTLALIYKPDTQTTLYGSYVEGLEPGSRVADRYANAGEVLDATVSKQAEIGIKRQVDAWDYSAAIFRIDRANQVDVIRGDDLYLTQDGLVLYQGAELSTAYQFTNNLNMGLGVIYLDATIDNVSSASADIEGNTPGNAPKWQIVGNVDYNVPNVPGLSVHGAVRYFDASYTSDNNLLTVSSRTVANAGFSYDFGFQDQTLTLIGNINNLFNEKYWAGGGNGAAGNVGEERNISLTLRAQL